MRDEIYLSLSHLFLVKVSSGGAYAPPLETAV